IDVKSGKVIEFQNEELEKLKKKIARELGYDLVGDKLELFGVRRKSQD
ncbi:MAG: transcriptional repressor, partial [Alphaproteobacteria bacterium]|nr:transcriptional repressor [Alphaproteobacteria bacterium]